MRWYVEDYKSVVSFTISRVPSGVSGGSEINAFATTAFILFYNGLKGFQCFKGFRGFEGFKGYDGFFLHYKPYTFVNYLGFQEFLGF